ncbi:hypothetical protein SLU01_12080 [Sporosarcina luteola]|uniref:Uncharacterized protein n=1 Tax=Sporosarcina luteola TaxID=582850 RepID=A0A511Z626_9BACL|nr:hypothetical protein SLU01_12080 [Sporosarcina luteola]
MLRVVKALQFKLKIGMFLHRQSSILRILRPAFSERCWEKNETEIDCTIRESFKQYGLFRIIEMK